MSAPTFGSVKAELALVVAGGVASTDPRVMALTNSAMRALMEDVPRGVYVGGVMQATVTSASGGLITLPPGMDVLLALELTSSVATAGWYSITNASTFVDPDDIMDTVFVDQGFTGTNGARVYLIPEMPAGGNSFNIFGLKSFAPVTGDSDTLIVPNIRAVKRMILSLDKSERYEDRVGGKEYHDEAVSFLVSELNRALLDPQRYASRLAQWRVEAASTYAPGTLGNTCARIALDMDRGQKVGRFKINRLVYRALAWIYQRVYEYQLIERNRVKAGPPTLTPVPTDPTALVSTASDPTVPIQHEIIRQVVQALMAEDHQGLDDDRGTTGTGRLTPGAELAVSQKLFQEASSVLIRVLDAQLESLRHTTYATALQGYIASGSQATLGYVVAKLGLELKDGLKMSDVELQRAVNEAAHEAIEQQNSLGKNERYSNADGPNSLTFAYTTDPTATLPFSNYEVLSGLVRAQLVEVVGGDAAALRAAAYAVIERNLATVVDAQRNTARYARLSTGPTSLGYLTARFGLEVPDSTAALAFSDNQLRRWVNEAAREALQQRNFLSRSERYSNLDGPEAVPFVPATTDAASVSYPDFEVLRRFVEAQMVSVPETARGFRTEAAAMIERNLQKSIEATRNQQWHCLLASNPYPQFGGTRAEIGLEFAGTGGEDGYKYSDAYVSRIVRQAWSNAVDQYNFLTRTEDYEQDILTPPDPVPDDAATITPFTLEVVKLYAESLFCQDRNEAERATAYKQQASQALQRNLVAVVEYQRRVECEQQQTLDPNSFGYVIGSLGLDIDNGLSMSVAKRRRLANKAEQLLANSGRWKFFEGEYILVVDPAGQVVVPSDVETIIFAEYCGQRVEVKSRKWFYTGFCTREGDGWAGWNGGALPLYFAGQDDCGNSTWILRSCSHQGGTIPNMRALCRRKWVPKVADSDMMLIEHYPAILQAVLSLLDKSGPQPDYTGASIKWNTALKALDDQLGVETEGQKANITVKFPGVPQGGMHGRGYGRYYQR